MKPILGVAPLLALSISAGCASPARSPEPLDTRAILERVRAQDDRRAAGQVRHWREDGFREELDGSWTASDRLAIDVARRAWEASDIRSATAAVPMFRVESTPARQIVTIVWLDSEERDGVRTVPGWGVVHVDVFGDGRPAQVHHPF